MKKFLKVIAFLAAMFVFACVVAMIPTGSTKNLAEGWDGDTDLCEVIDDAGLFSKKEKKALDSLIRDTAEELEINVLVYIGGSGDAYMTDEQTEAFAHNYYDETFGEYTDGILYYMDMSGGYGAYDFISTSGRAILMYQGDIDRIFTYLDAYLPASGQEIVPDEIYSAVEAFCSQLISNSSYDRSSFHDTYHGLYNYVENGKFKVTRNRPLSGRIAIAFGCILIAGIISLIVHACIKSHYKFKQSLNPTAYLSREKTVFSQRSDVQTRVYTTKTKIESSSGGGGGRSGGGSFGGSHGGGGHHR